MNSTRRFLVIGLALIAGVVSIGLLYEHYLGSGVSGFVSMLCGGEDAGSGCGAVASSPYATFLGIPLAAFGAFFYLFLAYLFMVVHFTDQEVRPTGVRLGFLAVSAAMGVNVVLLALQAFAVGAFCRACIITYVLAAGIFVVLFPQRKVVGAGGVRLSLVSPKARMFSFTVSSGAVLLGAAVVMTAISFSFQDPRKLEGRLVAQGVEEYYRSPAVILNTEGVPVLGRPGSPINVVVFSDFLCPFCRQTAQYFSRHVPQWEGRVVVYFKNYPLDKLCNSHQSSAAHAGACWAALGGLCSAEQDLFWEYHDRVFDDPPKNASGADFMEVAHSVGVDTVRMKECMLSTPMRKKVADEIEEGFALGIDGTPRVYVNGKLVSHLNYLTGVLRSEADRLGLDPLEGVDE